MANEEQMLRKLIDEIAVKEEIKNYDVIIEPISSGGANYTTRLLVVTVKGNKDLNLFAKVSILGEKMRDIGLVQVFDTERYFYTELSKIYRGIEVTNNIAEEHRVNFPKYYGCNPNYLEETIVLENLVHQGYGDYNRKVSVDWPYAESAIRELAKLHALSHAFKKYNPEEFEKTVKRLEFKFPMTEEQRQTLWEKSTKTTIDVINEENKERVIKYLNTKPSFFFEDIAAPVDTTVLMHGDYRVSNLLHKYNEDGTVSIKIVDLQTIQGGCPTGDLIYFIIMGTDEEFRRQYYDRLIEHYYEELCAALRRLGVDPNEVYPRKVYEHELKEKLGIAFQIAVFGLPVVTIEAENAPVVKQDSDMTVFLVENTSDLFPARINGVINDCIRWGVL